MSFFFPFPFKFSSVNEWVKIGRITVLDVGCLAKDLKCGLEGLSVTRI